MSEDHDDRSDWHVGEMDQAERERLRRDLRNPGRLKEFLTARMDERAMRDELLRQSEDAADQQSAGQASHPPQRWWWTSGLLAAAALLLVTTWFWSRAEVTPVGQIVSATGSISLIREGQDREAAVGTPLFIGDQVVVGASDSVSLLDADGVQAQLESTDADTSGILSVSFARRWSLERGDLALTVPPGSQGFAVDTPHATCRVLGTRFRVQVGAEGSAVTVDEGRVQWSTGASEPQIVTAGQRRSAGRPPVTDLIRWRFDEHGAHRSGSLAAEWQLRAGDGPLPLMHEGLLIQREDQVLSRLTGPEATELLDRLQNAQEVILGARLRFVDGVPRNQLLGNLFCQAAPDLDQRYFQLRWLGEQQSEATSWHTVAVHLERTGRNLYFVDGQQVHGGERQWIFDHWTPDIGLFLHQYHSTGNEEGPLGIIFQEVWIQVR